MNGGLKTVSDIFQFGIFVPCFHLVRIFGANLDLHIHVLKFPYRIMGEFHIYIYSSGYLIY